MFAYTVKQHDIFNNKPRIMQASQSLYSTKQQAKKERDRLQAKFPSRTFAVAKIQHTPIIHDLSHTDSLEEYLGGGYNLD